MLFLDFDGTLADFDSAFRSRFDREPDGRHETLDSAFYADLHPMPGAYRLLSALAERRPVILTTEPRRLETSHLKRARAAALFPGIPIAMVGPEGKHVYCLPGDVLIDDSERHEKPWRDAGGQFIRFSSTGQALIELSHILA